MKKESRKEKKGFIWWSLRIAFSLMVLLFILSFFVNIWVLNLLFLILLLFSIIVSIIHLFKHKVKAFAVTVLIISALVAIFYIIGILVTPVA